MAHHSSAYDDTPYPSFAGFSEGEPAGIAQPELPTSVGLPFVSPFGGPADNGDVASPIAGLDLPQLPRLRDGGRGRGGRNTTAGNDTTPTNGTAPVVVPDPVNGTESDPGNNGTTTQPPPVINDPCAEDPFCCDHPSYPGCELIFG